ncbi:MAG: saccharopine dehydrogenase family protein [Phycisphaerales bacterium]|nr:MAG: saccharopine dehydrogenase family protein [Phycisphaerales bacterium]
MANIVILGAGMVGSVMARDLARDADFDITLVDRSEDALSRTASLIDRPMKTTAADLSDCEAIQTVIAPADIVLGAMGSTIAYEALRTVIENGKNYCDISFMPENALELDDLARQRGVTAIVDCGVAPGMSNVLAGFAASRLDPCESIEIYVGGLPRERRWPFEYKAAFSPYDVIEEYTRPARLVEHGQEVVREALSEPEPIEFPGLGTLEAFITDGLRSLVDTLDVPFMKEKTLRYPGHIELMRAFRETGLFSEEPVELNGQRVVPRELLAKLMFPKWTYEPGEEDLTVMRVIATGRENGETVRLQWDLFDRFDRETGMTSMARTTGFPCTIMARRVLNGEFKPTGVIAPEQIGRVAGELDHLFAAHAERGVEYTAHRRVI